MTNFYKILYKVSSRNATMTEGGCHENFTEGSKVKVKVSHNRPSWPKGFRVG